MIEKMSQQPKIIVLDDDPTGSQTVHSCLLLLKWDVETLRIGIRHSSPIFFILTNTRALSPDEAGDRTRQVCQNLRQAIALEKLESYIIVSRSDSTLRGHYPLETDVINQELGEFSAHFLIPAFIEGGRVTIDSTHYIVTETDKTPVHETEFAKDSLFAYDYSYLPDYVAQKTQGEITAEDVLRITQKDIHQGIQGQLRQLNNNQCVAVDGETQTDLDLFAQDLLTVTQEGKKFLFRSAASCLTSLANLGEQLIEAGEMSAYKSNSNAGVFIAGSHVQKTTEQLNKLLEQPDVVGIEIDLKRLQDNSISEQQIIDDVSEKIDRILEGSGDKTPVVYTTREELQFPNKTDRIKFGQQVSQILVNIVRRLPSDIGFIVSKGGITSNDILSVALGLTTVYLRGQILAGCCLVTIDENHEQFPNLPIVLFPGNVGNQNSLVEVYQRLKKRN